MNLAALGCLTKLRDELLVVNEVLEIVMSGHIGDRILILKEVIMRNKSLEYVSSKAIVYNLPSVAFNYSLNVEFADLLRH